MFTRNLLLIGALCAILPFTQGCTDEDLAVGAGIVAIGAIGAAAGVAAASDHHHDHGWGHHHRWAVDELTSTGDTVAPSAEAMAIATQFHMSNASATKLLTSLQASRSGNLNALEQLGLTKADIQSIAQMQPLSPTAINQLATSLQQNPVDTQNMMTTLMKNAQADLQNVNGYVWTTCRESGQWKTPQNAYCASTDWSGCSPATGATACLPAAQ